MGTKVQIENYYLDGHCSMRDLSRESNGASWPSFFGDGNLPNGQVSNGFLLRNGLDSHSWYNKDVMKQTMLEHEAIFKNQVCELHRLYRVQRELMDEVRRKDQFERQIAYETSSSSSPVLKSENVRRWNGSSFPLANSVQSSPQSIKGKSIQGSSLGPFQNCYSPKNSEVSDTSRPTKHRRRMLDLQLPADEYLDTEEVEQFGDANISSSFEKNGNVTMENWKLLLNYTGKSEFRGDLLRSDSFASKSKDLADLNEPPHAEETAADFLHHTNYSNSFKDITQSSTHECLNGISKNYCLEKSSSNNQGIYLENKAAHFLSVIAPVDQAGQPPGFLKGHHFRGEDSWKAKSCVNLEKSDKRYSMSNCNVTEKMTTFHLPSQPSFFHPNSRMSQKSTSVQAAPFLAPVNVGPSKSSQSSSAKTNGFLDNKFNLNCSPGGNETCEGETYVRNGFDQESAATSFKELPVGFNSSGKDVFKATASQLKDLNLNVALPDDELQDHKSQYDPAAVQNRSAKEETGTSGRKLVFDMNLPCELSDSEMDADKEETGILENKMKTETGIIRNHFDLNSCVTDEEEIPCLSTTPLPDKDTGIDLEAPIILEDDEAILPLEDSLTKEPEKLPPDEGEAELATSAAEAIIAISSLVNIVQPEVEVICVPEKSDEEDRTLHWLADIACDSLPKELDEFECMTLRLKECTFEEYFPKPIVPEFLNIEEGNKHALTTRTRRGPGRKGRQKRDFQKDILPGLTSLSRNEVTEDMQTFGGLMRATGYSSWQCGPNRRNGGRRGRGRPRGTASVAAPVHAVSGPEAMVVKQQEIEMNSSNKQREVGLEDRSLTVTGWGKTTRRPRRQRLPTLPLSS